MFNVCLSHHNKRLLTSLFIYLCCTDNGCHVLDETADEFVSHLHCDSCVRRKCTAVIYPPCAMISCATFCGAVFHECKQSEHRELCPLEKVACINVENGCPMVLRRCDRSRHLAACPASVVCCTMEWCRWPMYSRERGTRVPFAPSSLRARCGQLDVALALRDQRTLDRAKKFPRRSLVRSLRNSFTKRYPAVPLLVGGNPTFAGNDDGNSAAEILSSGSEDEDRDGSSRAPWLTGKEPPGLQRSILNELFPELPNKSGTNGSPSILEAENVRCALCSKPKPDCPASATVCLTDADELALHSRADSDDRDVVCRGSHQSGSQNNPLHLLSNGCETSSDSDPAEWPSSQVAVEVARSETCHHGTELQETNYSRNNNVPPFDAASSMSAVATDSCTAGSIDAAQRKSEFDETVDTIGDVGEYRVATDRHLNANTTEREIDQAVLTTSISGVGSLVPEQSSESLPLTLHEVLAVDLNIEVCSRYHIRDPSLYSFICAQLFRRDEFTRHVRDVHSTIHDAIDHWLEVRCPLAHYGCTFSMHRRLPSGADIIFSPLLESLGLRRTNESLPKAPVESLPHVCTQMPTLSDTPSTADALVEHLTAASTDMVAPECLPEEPEKSLESSRNCLKERTSDILVSSTLAEGRDLESLSSSSADGKVSDLERYGAKEPAKSLLRCENRPKECTPEMFTSTEYDSTVCIRPRSSKEPTPVDDDNDEVLCLTGMPFELLVRIATFLDSFSLCNLSLTCWLMRDVCRSLLKQQGLVVQEWQRDCSWSSPRWKISHQVSLFLH